jgi:MATE family multidrug resistance protein
VTALATDPPGAHAALTSRAVFALAAPAVANSLLQTLVFVVDRAVLGHFDDTAIAAMQTAGPITWTLFSVFGCFSVGTVAVVGRAVGAQDPDAATRAARASIFIGLLSGTLVAALAWLLVGPMVDAFGDAAGPAVRAVTVAYLRAMLPGLPAMFVGLAALSTLQAAGDTRTPLAIGLATNALNLAANYVLVFGALGFPRLGATGSALGTVCAALLEAALALAALSRADAKVSLRTRRIEPAGAVQARANSDRASARAVLRVASGSLGERLVYHAGYLLFVRFVTLLGADAMAANQALIAIESVSFLTAEGFAVAAGALVAQRLGAGEPHEARRAGWLAATQCAAVLGACAGLFVLCAGPLVRVFVPEPRIVALAVPVLRFAALAQIPMAIAMVLAQSVRAAGSTREAFAVSLLGALLVRISATYVCVVVLRLGLLGVWIGSTVDWIVRAAIYARRWSTGAALPK